MAFTCSFCEKGKEFGVESAIDGTIIICNDCIKLATEKLTYKEGWNVDSDEPKKVS